MQSFQFASARSFAEAASLLGPDAMLVAGGTDLVPLMRDRLVAPRLLIDVKSISTGTEVSVSRGGGASIGSLTTLTDLARHPGLRRLYPALAMACTQVGTPQIRNVATIAGNLCQRPRCWYYRSSVTCWKSGSPSCPAHDGMNEFLAVLGGGPCWAPHPSDLAVCLTALDARIILLHGEQQVELPLEELYDRAADNRQRETCLEDGDVIERIIIPARYAGAPQHFLKVTQRQAWDFALVSVAVVWPKRGRRPRITLGGVAPKPWLVDAGRLPAAPRPTARGATVELWAVNVAEHAVRGARALSQNAYKIPMAKAAVRRALIETFPPR